jgi:hypothetical protein
VKYKISSIKTKAQFQAVHKRQWNMIIKKITNREQNLPTLKRKCFKKLFNQEITSHCFGCYWKYGGFNNKRECLFKTKKPCFGILRWCLDGLYLQALQIFRGYSKAEKISIAEKIRDFPIA